MSKEPQLRRIQQFGAATTLIASGGVITEDVMKSERLTLLSEIFSSAIKRGVDNYSVDIRFSERIIKNDYEEIGNATPLHKGDVILRCTMDVTWMKQP